jgi:hypothetical protein
VSVVGVVGSDYPIEKLDPLKKRGVDFSGLERAEGQSFRWRGRYRHDLNSAETLETHLGVFSHFSPKIPAKLRSSPYLFLANIDPRLQLDVLGQVDKPKLVACDTMNFWIQSRRADVLKLLGHVDLMTLNDAEARQLTEKANLVQAAQWIMARGPRHVIIKKGEHGAFMFTDKSIFFAPAFPLENVFDPTGAGDAFAGGFIGYLAATIWVFGPYVVVPLWDHRYHAKYVEQFLPQALGLTGLGDFPSMVALLVAIGGGSLDRQSFRSGIDWATLVLFGVLLGAGGVLRAGGVDRWIAGAIVPITRSLGDPVFAILLLALLGVLVRLVLPMVPAAFLLLLTLVPAAPQLGLQGWVVGFVTSVVVLTWILPRQYEVLRMFREITDGEMFSERQAVAVGVAITLIAVLALLISVPYWRAIGLA